jgi:glutamine synthetase
MIAIKDSPHSVIQDSAQANIIREWVENGSVKFIRFEWCDIHGIARSKTVPARHFERFASKGLNVPLPTFALDVQGLTAPNTGYLEEIGFADSLFFPDINTFQVLPWVEKTARVLGDPYVLADGRPAKAAPRWVVKPLLDKLDSMGYRLLSGFEYEFYLVDAQTQQPSFPEIRLFAIPHVNDRPVIYNILESMEAVGVDIITADLEYAPGQIEINFAPAWGLDAADQAFTFKNGVKEIAQQSGRIASFMTKPDAINAASGCHFNQSLWQGDRNAFVDPDREHGLSDVALHYLAGQLAHAPALLALLAPTINCWKRYKPDSFAPANITWGIDNRTTAIRAKVFRDERTYIENRLGSGASNPYLVMAAVLAAGIDGIKHKLEPPAPRWGLADRLEDVPQLPTRLDDALDALEQDTVIRDALGAEFIKLFVAIKRHEIAKARDAIANYDSAEFFDQVTDWERQEFFEFL